MWYKFTREQYSAINVVFATKCMELEDGYGKQYIFQITRRMECENFHIKKDKCWGDRYVEPDLNTIQYIQIIKHHLVPTSYIQFYVISERVNLSKIHWKYRQLKDYKWCSKK